MPSADHHTNTGASPDWDIFDGYFDMASGEAEIDVDMAEETPLMRADVFGATAAVSDGGGGEGMDVHMHTNASVQGACALLALAGRFCAAERACCADLANRVEMMDAKMNQMMGLLRKLSAKSDAGRRR